MDARGWCGEPDARDDAYEHDGHQRVTRRLRYRYACEALRLWIAQASDPSAPTWAPYSGEAQANAVWYARHCYREAHALGLLEREPVKARGAA